VSHPPPSKFWELKRSQAMLQQELSSRCALLHPIASAMVTQFPDPRLIQYDCGELLITCKKYGGGGSLIMVSC
jgi:E1A-binding protein p400